MTPPRILIACIGNIFLGDDAFGVEVGRRLAGRPLPDGVRVEDYGIRSLDLAFALLDGPETTIFVDATTRGGAPGSLYVIEPDLDAFDGVDPGPAVVEAHTMNPISVLSLVRTMGGTCGRILLVGCEPETLGGADGAMGLSEPVQRAVDEAVAMIDSLVVRILEERVSRAIG